MKLKILASLVVLNLLATLALAYASWALWGDSKQLRTDVDAAGGNSVSWEQDLSLIRSRIETLEKSDAAIQEDLSGDKAAMQQLAQQVQMNSAEIGKISSDLLIALQQMNNDEALSKIVKRLERIEGKTSKAIRLPEWVNDISIQLRPAGPVVMANGHELIVGGDIDGWTLRSIDPAQRIVVLQHNNTIRAVQVQ